MGRSLVLVLGPFLLFVLVACGQVSSNRVDAADVDAAVSIDADVCESPACGPADGCCPATGCGANADPDCPGVCGNGILEVGEACDPRPETSCVKTIGGGACTDSACAAGSDSCASGDSCCPYGCGSANDSGCRASGWLGRDVGLVEWPADGGCTEIRVNGMRGGDSVMFTTCSPGGGATGDSMLLEVRDNTGNGYAVDNDDCGQPTAIPTLAGWSCLNEAGATYMSCTGNNSGGFVLDDDPAISYVTMRVCGYPGSPSPGAPPGAARFSVLWNGSSNPSL
jgi:hypothetical protein